MFTGSKGARLPAAPLARANHNARCCVPNPHRCPQLPQFSPGRHCDFPGPASWRGTRPALLRCMGHTGGGREYPVGLATGQVALDVGTSVLCLLLQSLALSLSSSWTWSKLLYLLASQFSYL